MSSPSVVLTESDIMPILELAEVVSAKEVIDSMVAGNVSFTVPLSDAIKQKLKDGLGIDLFAVELIPLRWIKGDTAPHVDVGSSKFDSTYLVYLTPVEGVFRVGNTDFPIAVGSGFVFSEGVRHETVDMGDTPRLLIGPMNETGRAVGGFICIYYYATEADAVATINNIASCEGVSYTVGCVSFGNIGSITRWRIASSSTGPSPQGQTYQNGDVLIDDGIYHLYPASDDCCGIIPSNTTTEVRTEIIQGAIILQQEGTGAQAKRPIPYDVKNAMRRAAASRR